MKSIKEIIVTILVMLAIIIFASMVTGCGSGNVKTEPTEYKIDGHTLTEITIDGCQYLSSYQANGMIFVHKGNCTNHRSK